MVFAYTSIIKIIKLGALRGTLKYWLAFVWRHNRSFNLHSTEIFNLNCLSTATHNWMCFVKSNLSPNIYPQQIQNYCITFIHCWANVGDVGPTLYKCYTNVLCLLGQCCLIWEIFFFLTAGYTGADKRGKAIFAWQTASSFNWNPDNKSPLYWSTQQKGSICLRDSTNEHDN